MGSGDTTLFGRFAGSQSGVEPPHSKGPDTGAWLRSEVSYGVRWLDTNGVKTGRGGPKAYAVGDGSLARERAGRRHGFASGF